MLSRLGWCERRLASPRLALRIDVRIQSDLEHSSSQIVRPYLQRFPPVPKGQTSSEFRRSVAAPEYPARHYSAGLVNFNSGESFATSSVLMWSAVSKVRS